MNVTYWFLNSGKLKTACNIRLAFVTMQMNTYHFNYSLIRNNMPGHTETLSLSPFCSIINYPLTWISFECQQCTPAHIRWHKQSSEISFSKPRIVWENGAPATVAHTLTGAWALAQWHRARDMPQPIIMGNISAIKRKYTTFGSVENRVCAADRWWMWIGVESGPLWACLRTLTWMTNSLQINTSTGTETGGC